MTFFYLLNKMFLFIAIAGSVGFIIGYSIAYIKGHKSGFESGSYQTTKRIISIMDKVGSFTSYCEAMASYARHEGYSEDVVQALMKEATDMLIEAKLDEKEKVRL